MKIRCIISLVFFFASAVHGMELALSAGKKKKDTIYGEKKKCKQIIFSEIPHDDKLAILSPILRGMKGNFASIHSFLSESGFDGSHDIALVNKVITFLAQLHNMPTGTLAMCVNTPACRHYANMGESLVNASTPQFFDGPQIKTLLAHGADVNYEAYCFGQTVLMNSVYYNNPSLVAFYLRMGADIKRYDCWGNTARDFNVIYNTTGSLKKLVVSIRRYKRVIKDLSINKQSNRKAIAQQMYNLPASKAVRKALRIDKTLENAYNSTIQNKTSQTVIASPVKVFMKIFPTKTAVLNFLFDIFGGNVRDYVGAVPKSMRQYLKI